MSSTSHHGSDDDLMIFTMGTSFLSSCCSLTGVAFLDPLNALDESQTQVQSDLSTSDYHSFVAPTDASVLVDTSPAQKKMFDITDLLGSSPFDDKQEASHWFEKLQPISTSSPTLNVVDYLRAQAFKFDQDLHDKQQWQLEQNHLKYGEHPHSQGHARVTLLVSRFQTVVTHGLSHPAVSLQSSGGVRERFAHVGSKSLGQIQELLAPELHQFVHQLLVHRAFAVVRPAHPVHRTSQRMQRLSRLFGIFKRKSLAIVLHAHRFARHHRWAARHGRVVVLTRSFSSQCESDIFVLFSSLIVGRQRVLYRCSREVLQNRHVQLTDN